MVSGELFVFAIVATLSPLGFAATLAVIASGRLRALVFAAAFVAAQFLSCAVLVLVGTAVAPSHGRRFPVFRSLLELAVGVALLCFAAFVRSRPADSAATSTGGSAALLDRLRHLRVPTAAGAGVLLGVGGPKRLVLTALAAASIGTSGGDALDEAVSVLAYALVATLLVWAPILVFLIIGDRVATALHAAQRWLALRQRSVAVYSSLAVGVIAVADSLVRLV
ncbi:MAG TPA: GAP family protein [Gaiellaceae bacterium]